MTLWKPWGPNTMTDQSEVVSDTSLPFSETWSNLNAVGIAWFLTTFGVTPGSLDLVEPSAHQHTSSSHEAVQEVFTVRSTDLVDALIHLRNRLEQRGTEIEPEVKKVLYENLWDLYQE